MHSYLVGSPEFVVVAEMSGRELTEASSVYDLKKGAYLSKFALIEVEEFLRGSQKVFLNSTEFLSSEAKLHNARLCDSRELTVERMIFAAVSKRPPSS